MGLDIYVEWDNMTDEEHKAQLTGFTDSVQTGYLRFNWGGVGFMSSYAAENNWPNPIADVFMSWTGDNGDGFMVDKGTLTDLIVYQKKLNDWLEEHSADERQTDDYKYYHRKIVAWVGLIDFIHQHKDKPNLVVVYG